MTKPESPGTAGSESVGPAVRSAMLWNLASMAFSQVALAGIFLLLTQRLDPTTFGHYALAAVLTDLFFVLASSAATDALLQRQNFSRRTLSTVFWLALAISVVVTLLLAICSELYANAVGEPQVAPVLQALSLSTLFIPLSVGPTALMRQRLEFRGIALRGIVSAFAGGLAALATTYSPWADWALVAQRLVSLGSGAALMILHTRVVPAVEFDAPAARQLLGASTRIFAGQCMASATPRVIDLCIGLFFGAATLGCLRVATKLTEIILAALVNPIGQLWVVLVSRAGASAHQRRDIFLQLSTLIALLALPGYFGVALIAADFTKIALPLEYAQVADLLIITCVLGAFAPLTNSRNAILTALSKYDRLVWYASLDLVSAVAGLLLMRPFGPTAMLMGTGLASVVLVPIALPYLLKQMHTKGSQLIGSLLPAYVAAATMCVGVIVFQTAFPNFEPWPNLLLKSAIGAAIYVGVLFGFFRRSVSQSTQRLFKQQDAWR